MRATRIATIINGSPDEEPKRLRLELRRIDNPMPEHKYQWYDAASEEWIEGPKHPTVKSAMKTLYAWYGGGSGWDLKTRYIK